MATATAKVQTFRCMACGNEWEQSVQKDEDKERTCSQCRSNSIRHIKHRPPKEG